MVEVYACEMRFQSIHARLRGIQEAIEHFQWLHRRGAAGLTGGTGLKQEACEKLVNDLLCLAGEVDSLQDVECGR
jgi:hypothetical protein